MTTIEELQKELMLLLERIGDFKVEPKKGSIHIVHGRAFVGIHPKKSYLGVNVVLDKNKAFPRADKIEQVSLNRFHHFFKIESKERMTISFVRLLQEAYHLTDPKR
jgi:Domain of unknown function (DUF5655)